MGDDRASQEPVVMLFELLMIALEAETEQEQVARAKACLRRYGRPVPELEPEVIAALRSRYISVGE